MEGQTDLEAQRLPAEPAQQRLSRDIGQNQTGESTETATQSQNSRQADHPVENEHMEIRPEASAAAAGRVESRILSSVERRRLWNSLFLLWWPGSTLLYSYRRRIFVVVSRASGAYGPEDTEDTLTIPFWDLLSGRYGAGPLATTIFPGIIVDIAFTLINTSLLCGNFFIVIALGLTYYILQILIHLFSFPCCRSRTAENNDTGQGQSGSAQMRKWFWSRIGLLFKAMAFPGGYELLVFARSDHGSNAVIRRALQSELGLNITTLDEVQASLPAITTASDRITRNTYIFMSKLFETNVLVLFFLVDFMLYFWCKTVSSLLLWYIFAPFTFLSIGLMALQGPPEDLPERTNPWGVSTPTNFHPSTTNRAVQSVVPRTDPIQPAVQTINEGKLVRWSAESNKYGRRSSSSDLDQESKWKNVFYNSQCPVCLEDFHSIDESLRKEGNSASTELEDYKDSMPSEMNSESESSLDVEMGVSQSDATHKSSPSEISDQDDGELLIYKWQCGHAVCQECFYLTSARKDISLDTCFLCRR